MDYLYLLFPLLPVIHKQVLTIYKILIKISAIFRHQHRTIQHGIKGPVISTIIKLPLVPEFLFFDLYPLI